MKKLAKRSTRKQKEFIQTLSFFAITIASIVGLIAYLWVYTEIDETVINIETQKQVSKELKNSLNELEIEISRLSRGDRISNFARKELGMIPAKPETIMIYIDQEDLAQMK